MDLGVSGIHGPNVALRVTEVQDCAHDFAVRHHHLMAGDHVQEEIKR